MAKVFDPLNPDQFDANLSSYTAALERPRRAPRAAAAPPVGSVSTPTVSRTVPTVTTPAAAPAAASMPPKLSRTSFADPNGIVLNPALQKQMPTFQGTNLEVPMHSKPVGYQVGQFATKLVRSALNAGSRVADAAKSATDVVTYPARKAINVGAQIGAGALGAKAPAPAELFRPNAAPVAATAPTLAPAGTAMPRSKGAVMRDGRGAANAAAATPASAAVPTAATPVAAPAQAVNRTAPTTALDGGGTFNGRPVADLLAKPKNPISIMPSDQMPAAMTPAAAGLSTQQLGLTLPARTAPAATMDRSGTFNGQSITTALQGVTNPASNVGASPNVPGATPAAVTPMTAAPVLRTPPTRQGPKFSVANGMKDQAGADWNFDSKMQYTKMTPTERAARLAMYGAEKGAAEKRALTNQEAGIAAAAAAAEAANAQALADGNNAVAMQMEAARQASDERRALIQQQPIMGEDGTVFTRNGAIATPLTTPDGKPVRAAPTKSNDAALIAVMNSLDAARTASGGVNGDPAAIAAFDSSSQGQMLMQLQKQLAGQSTDVSPAQKAITDARAAIATGKITAEEARKRIQDAGYSTEGL